MVSRSGERPFAVAVLDNLLRAGAGVQRASLSLSRSLEPETRGSPRTPDRVIDAAGAQAHERQHIRALSWVRRLAAS